MLSISVCQNVLSRALSRGGSFAEIFYEDTKTFGLTLRDRVIENAAVSRPRGAGVRIYDGLRSIYVYTCDVSEAGLLRAADRAAAAVTDTKGSGRCCAGTPSTGRFTGCRSSNVLSCSTISRPEPFVSVTAAAARSAARKSPASLTSQV